MRIVGGKHRGRRLAEPDGREIRPTSDRVRQSVFDILCHWTLTDRASPVEGTRVLDLFCGTGAMGIEALSRGAAHCTFVDSSFAAAALVRQNLAALGETGRADVRHGDAASLPAAVWPCDLLFLDPPYRSELAASCLAQATARGWVGADAVVVLETARAEAVPDFSGFTPLAERVYGNTRISLFIRAPLATQPTSGRTDHRH